MFNMFTQGSGLLFNSPSMRRLVSIFFLVAIAGFALGTAPALAASGPSFAQRLTGEQARDACKSGHVMCAKRALGVVKKRYPRLRHSNTYLKKGAKGRQEYVVKMMSRDGHMVEVRVDARSGRILGTKGN